MNNVYQVEASQFKVYSSNVDPNDYILACIFNPNAFPFEESEFRLLKKLNKPEYVNDCGLINHSKRQGKLIRAGKHALYYRFGSPQIDYMDVGNLRKMYTELDTFTFTQNEILYRIVPDEMGGTKLQQWIRSINDKGEKWHDCQHLAAMRPFTVSTATVYEDQTPQQKWLELLEDFEDAVRWDEMAGSQNPEDIDSIHQRFIESKQKIKEFISSNLKTK